MPADNVEIRLLSASGAIPLIGDLERMSADMRIAVSLKVEQLTKQLQEAVKANLSGPVLKPGNPPRLRDSIQYRVDETSSTIQGTVFSSGVPYAAIHEYGGKTRQHVIEGHPFLRFPWLAGSIPIPTRPNDPDMIVTVPFVIHPGSLMPKRSYMGSAIRAMRPYILAELRGTVYSTWSK